MRDNIALRSSGDLSFVQMLTLFKISPMGNLYLVVLELLVYCLDVEVRHNSKKKKKAQAALELLTKLWYEFFITTNVLITVTFFFSLKVIF